MSYYQTPTANDTIGMYEFVSYVNTVSGGILFPVLMFVIWIVGFLSIKQYSTPRAWTFSSLLCAILSIISSVLDLTSSKVMYVFIMFTAVGLVWMKLEESV